MDNIKNFSTLFRQLLQASGLPRVSLKKHECQTFSGPHCTICPAIDLSYPDELKIKNEAFRQFWKTNNLAGVPEPIVPSPTGRGYRTNSKRRAFRQRDQVLLGLTDISESGKIRPLDVIQCPIEPKEHSLIYNFLQQYISTRDGRALAEELNYAIIKGSYDEYTVILNVKSLQPELNAIVNHFSKNLTKEFKKIVSLFVAVDEHSKYYLSDKLNAFKKVFGKKEIYQKAGPLSFLYSPLSFSQTNGAMIETMTNKISELMNYRKNEVLYDLYCGYGLLGLSAAPFVKSVIGVEVSGEAVRSARENAKRQKAIDVRYISNKVTAEILNKIFESGPGDEVVILDPPRNGTDPGVIECLAERRIKKALHIFCDIDLIPQEISRWIKSGYRISKIVPLDMFPATDNVETMVLLEP